MTLIVHISGLADLGIDGRCPNADEKFLEFSAKINKASETPLPADNTPSQIHKELFTAITENTPFGTVLNYRETLTFPWTYLIISTEKGDRPTKPYADGLSRAHKVLKQAYPYLNQITFEHLTFDDLNSVSVEEIAEKITTLRREAEPCYLLLGGGATNILVDTAAALDNATGADWTFLPLKNEAKEIPGFITRKHTHEYAYHRWLLSLGLPLKVNPSVFSDSKLSKDITKAQEAMNRALNSDDDSTPKEKANAMALVTYCDIARGDLSAGLSIRAWITSEYQHLRAQDPKAEDAFNPNAQDPTAVKAVTKTHATLGDAIEGQKKRRGQGKTLETCNQWLIEQESLKTVGIKATHDAHSPRNDSTNHTDAEGSIDIYALVDEKLSPTVQRPSWLSWPSPQLCLIYAQGHDKEQGSIPKKIIDEKQDEQIKNAVGYPYAPTQMTILCLATKEASPLAQELQANTGTWKPADDWAPSPNFKIIDSPSGEKSTELGTLKKEIESEIRAHPPRAIIVATTGKKELAFTALFAAQDAAAEHGIPVFLYSRTKNKGTTNSKYHAFGLNRDHRPAILQLALECVERLDLYTAHRLLSIGDATLQSLGNDAADLAQRLQELVNTAPTLDARRNNAPDIVDVLDCIATLMSSAAPTIDSQLRLITIAAEIVNLDKSLGKADPLFAANADATQAGDINTLRAADLLRILIEVRNHIPINHGAGTLNTIMSMVASTYGRKGKERSEPLTHNGHTPTYSELLNRTVEALRDKANSAESSARESTWKANYDTLRQKLRELIEVAPSVERDNLDNSQTEGGM